MGPLAPSAITRAFILCALSIVITWEEIRVMRVEICPSFQISPKLKGPLPLVTTKD